MKKIIGYNLNELGKENLAAIAAIVKHNKSVLKGVLQSNRDNYEWEIEAESSRHIALEKAGVLNIWCTPVYERKIGYVPNDLGWGNIKACAAIVDETEEFLYELWSTNPVDFGWAFSEKSSHAQDLREAKVLDIWFDKVENK